MTRQSRIYGLHSLKDLLSSSSQSFPSLNLHSISAALLSLVPGSEPFIHPKKRMGPACCSCAAAHFTTVKREHVAPCLEAVWKTTHKCPMRHTSSRPGQQIMERPERKRSRAVCVLRREGKDARAVRNGPIGEVRAIYHLKPWECLG